MFTSEREGRSEAKAEGSRRNGEPPCQGETAHQAGSDPRFSSALWLQLVIGNFNEIAHVFQLRDSEKETDEGLAEKESRLVDEVRNTAFNCTQITTVGTVEAAKRLYACISIYILLIDK